MAYVKDPADALDFEVDWDTWLATGETIAAVDWTVPAGIVEPASPTTEPTGTTATIWLEGGTAGEDYDIGCRITTNQGRIVERSFTVLVREL